MPGPIKPSEVDKRDVIPQTVFEIFNVLITVAWDGYEAVVKQSDVVERITRDFGISPADVYTRHYLDVEEAYEKVGWIVEYDKPGYNELGTAIFRFTKKKRK